VNSDPDAGALPTSVPNSVSPPLMALLELSRSRIRQLITQEGMPTDPDEAKLWYDANAKKNPSYKQGPAKHEELLLAGACVEGGSSVVAVSSSSVNTGILQHVLGGISAVRVHQLKVLGMPTNSLDDAVLWRRNRITHSNHTAGARTKANPAPGLFANQLRVKFGQKNTIRGQGRVLYADDDGKSEITFACFCSLLTLHAALEELLKNIPMVL
jgi:hypothetical protein